MGILDGIEKAQKRAQTFGEAEAGDETAATPRREAVGELRLLIEAAQNSLHGMAVFLVLELDAVLIVDEGGAWLPIVTEATWTGRVKDVSIFTTGHMPEDPRANEYPAELRSYLAVDLIFDRALREGRILIEKIRQGLAYPPDAFERMMLGALGGEDMDPALKGQIIDFLSLRNLKEF